MSPELWKELNRWAGEDFRSLNGQIEFLLHKAVQQRQRHGQESPNSDDNLD